MFDTLIYSGCQTLCVSERLVNDTSQDTGVSFASSDVKGVGRACDADLVVVPDTSDQLSVHTCLTHLALRSMQRRLKRSCLTSLGLPQGH